MNILKFVLVLFTATGFGFGVEELIENNIKEETSLNEEDNYDDDTVGFCHRNDEYFLEHMIERLTDEEAIIVQAKIDELLNEFDVTMEQLNSDFDVRYQFMIELMEFLDENGIDYHYNHYEEDDYGNHMGMHR